MQKFLLHILGNLLFISIAFAQSIPSAPPGVPIGGGFTQISKEDGTGKCWGYAIKFTDAPTANADGTCSVSSGGSISDTAYSAAWNGDTTTGASKNALYDKIETLASGSSKWTTNSNIIHPNNNATDEVVIGGTTEGTADIFLGADGSAVFNEQGASVDFRVEGNTIDNLFVVDASDDDVEINGGLNINLPGGDSIVIDGSTNNRAIDTGTLQIDQTPSISDTRALTINLDINSQATSHAQVTNIVATGLAPGETATAYDTNVDRSTSTGGVIRGYEMSIAGAGSAVGHLMHADPGIVPLTHFSGVFINVEQAWDENGGFLDVTTAFNSTSTDVTLFNTNGDMVHIGMDNAFNEIQVNLSTFAGGAGIKPVFEYSSGGGTPVWTVFMPQDETQGFRQSGVINWDIDDLVTPTWAAATINSVSKLYIRITRTQASIPTDPIEDTIQVVRATVYFWNAAGKIFSGSIATGKSSNTITTEGNSETTQIIAHIDDAFSETVEFTAMRHSDTAASGAAFYGIRSRGTHASSTVVQDDDVLFWLRGEGHDGTDFNDAASIKFEVDGTPGANDMPGRIVFQTSADGGNTLIEAMRIDNSQNTLFSGILQDNDDMVFEVDADDNGSNSFIFTDGASTQIATLDEAGNFQIASDMIVSGGDITFGNIAARIGDGVTDSITLSTDGTGDDEIVLPDNSIGDSEVLNNITIDLATTVTTNANLTGIVTSTGNATVIANKAIAIAKLADGTDGELITWDAAGVIDTVAVGTATHVLTSNGVGVAPTFQASAAGGLWTDLAPNLEPNDDGDGIQINDSGGTDFVVQSHDGTDYNFVGTNTAQYTFDKPIEIASGDSSVSFNNTITADPCGTGTAALDTGALYFSSGGHFCYCDDTATSVDLLMSSDGACTY